MDISKRINEIDFELKSFKKSKAGDYLQAIKHNLYCEKRRLKIKLTRINHGGLTLTEKINYVKKMNYKCNFCGSENNPSIDHIIPISKGGKETLDNLQVLCISCNSKKGGKYA
jgi:5-methylcytosine-specific restriction endonuclease McrA